MRLRNRIAALRTSRGSGDLWSALWTDAELAEEPDRAPRFLYDPPESTCHVTLGFRDAELFGRDVRYARTDSETFWTLAPGQQHQNNTKQPFPTRISICPQHAVPLRAAKNHTAFRQDLLERMRDAYRVLCNMVLFKCNDCKKRFCAFHPKCATKEPLDCVKACPNDVQYFDVDPPDEHATCLLYTSDAADE